MTREQLLQTIADYKISSKPTVIQEHDIVEFNSIVGTVDSIYFSDSKLEWNISVLKGRKKTGYSLGDWKTYGEKVNITDETVLSKIDNPCNLELVSVLQDKYHSTDSILESDELERTIKKELNKCPHSWKNISSWNYNKYQCRHCSCIIEDDEFSYDFEK